MHNLDLTYTWLDVLVVWLYPIQLYVELIVVERPLDLYTSMQRHPCIPKKVPPILAPSLVINLNSPSPSMVLLESPTWNSLIVIFLLMFSLLFATLEPWSLLKFHLSDPCCVYNMFMDTLYPLKQLLVRRSIYIFSLHWNIFLIIHFYITLIDFNTFMIKLNGLYILKCIW